MTRRKRPRGSPSPTPVPDRDDVDDDARPRSGPRPLPPGSGRGGGTHGGRGGGVDGCEMGGGGAPMAKEEVAVVLTELRRALEVVRATRRGSTSQVSPVGGEGQHWQKIEANLQHVPGLVNRAIVLAQTPDVLRPTAAGDVVELIVSIVVEFVEPLLSMQTDRDDEGKGRRQSQEGAGGRVVGTEQQRFDGKYVERVLTWAAERMQDLLRPCLSSDIPELDALLAATGRHDGLEHDCAVRAALSSSARDRRNLRLGRVLTTPDLVRWRSAESKREQLGGEVDSLVARMHAADEYDVGAGRGGNGVEGMGCVSLVPRGCGVSIPPGPSEWLEEIDGAASNGNSVSSTTKLPGTKLKRTSFETIAENPFLGYMQDFLKRHGNDACPSST